ncbi:unnamed protein product [Musa acuminata subsp. malaccensis]|uniref:(wild Malaysian banana) hypothetical protein n=1 Tax=Musa acuminata subsp. malaccensis TaxID=214687 RepID=A0A8D7BFD1_MUSAM|nr:unnamed protein product [Musa acuminata subsp. malaccensis]
MGTNGLMFYHLKSHLQAVRTSKANRKETKPEAKKNGSNSSKTNCSSTTNSDVSRTDGVGEILLGEALRYQIEVQRKLQEQLVVQKKLQMRIEALGKCL